MGYSPWGCKESDMTEQRSKHARTHWGRNKGPWLETGRRQLSEGTTKGLYPAWSHGYTYVHSCQNPSNYILLLRVKRCFTSKTLNLKKRHYKEKAKRRLACQCCAGLSRSAVSSSLWPRGLPTRLCCPWGVSGQEYWRNALLQGIFSTQGSKPGLLQ